MEVEVHDPHGQEEGLLGALVAGKHFDHPVDHLRAQVGGDVVAQQRVRGRGILLLALEVLQDDIRVVLDQVLILDVLVAVGGLALLAVLLLVRDGKLLELLQLQGDRVPRALLGDVLLVLVALADFAVQVPLDLVGVDLAGQITQVVLGLRVLQVQGGGVRGVRGVAGVRAGVGRAVVAGAGDVGKQVLLGLGAGHVQVLLGDEGALQLGGLEVLGQVVGVEGI